MKKVPEKRKIVDLLLISRLGTFVFSFSWPFREKSVFSHKEKIEIDFAERPKKRKLKYLVWWVMQD
tara:strand:+ start:810 stop:1007 length:198 start_codon:yes stop_codon:yes gene_type:complete